MSVAAVTPRAPPVATTTESASITASPGVTSTGTDSVTVTGLEAARIAELLVGRGLPLHELTPHRTSLEEAFVELTRNAVEFAAESVMEPAA